jgi:hypothetical protein
MLDVHHRDFYAVRDTSVMLFHGDAAKRVAEYVAASVVVVETSYGTYIYRV